MALTLTITPGYTFQENEVLTADKLNLAANPIVNLSGNVSTLAIADSSVTTPKLADGVLSASLAGRAKMEDGFVTPEKLAAEVLAKMLGPGFMMPYGSDVEPEGWLECDGREVLRADYPELFEAIGIKWGAPSDGTKFKLPDGRGMFLRGWDHGRGEDVGRAFASRQEDLIKNHTHALDGSILGGPTGQTKLELLGGSTAMVNVTGNPSSGGGAETRPKNIAVMWVIKY